MYSPHSPSIHYKRHPHIPLTHDMPSDIGPKRPLLEEDDFHFHARHTSTPSPSPQPESNTLSSSPAAMFLSTFMNSPQQSSPNPDDQGQVISGYTLGHIIGYGSTSVIRRASSFSGDVVAVKIIRRADLVKAGNAPQARKRLQHEASIWSSLSHEHILPLFSAVYTDYADYFITLYCPAGSLFDILKRNGQPALLQDDAGMMFRQVVRGLRYLHEISQLVHRDMKLENVLVDEMGMCRISDFGMSRHIGSEDSEDEDEDDQLPDVLSLANSSVHRAVSLTAPSSKRLPGNFHTNHHINRHNTVRHRNSTSSNKPVCPPGSLPYAAPELLLPQTSDALQPRPSQDIWALGVMLYTLLTGCLPFTDSFEPRLQMKILKGVYSVPKDIGRGAEQILQGCLEKKISDRWNIAMVDDVAWEVGWGAEGDGATPSNPDDEPALQYRPVPRHSRSRAQHPDLKLKTLRTTIHREQEEQCPRLSFEAASPSSSSRDSSLSLLSPTSPTLPDYMIPSSSSPASSPTPSYQVPSSVSSSPAVSLARGRRPRKGPQFMSRSPSRSVIPSNPNDDAQASPISTIMDHLDELHLDRSLRVRSIRSSLHSNDKSDTKRVQPTAGFEDEIADWTAHTRDLESIERGDTEMHAMLKSETLTSITAAFDHYQPPQRAGSLPRPGPKVNNSNSYMEHRATAAEPFLNLGPVMSPSNLPRCRSAEYNRYFG